VPPLTLDPDRLLAADGTERAVGRELFAQVADLPLVSPHGHVDPGLLAEDRPFPDPAALFVTPDHYVTRMLHSQGVPFASLGLPRVDGVGVDVETADRDPREIWRLFCRHWPAFRGTPSRLWLTQGLYDLFGIRVRPSEETADEIYDEIVKRLAEPQSRPRRLYEQFHLEVLATTDSPLSDLAAHRTLAADPDWHGRVVPTFRPDDLLDFTAADWPARVARLAEVSDCNTGTYAGFVAALEQRRQAFRDLGATATDHGPPKAASEELTDDAAAPLYQRALAGKATDADRDVFQAHMLGQFARMSCDDGLVMQLHPGVLRDHNAGLRDMHGRDIGGDIPTATDFVHALRPLLNRYGSHPNFTLVVFTVDETTFSRELAPMAGHYPAMRLGAPWWFLDAPDAMRRFREATTETAGFYNTAGFVDDTRAFCSIPARHDVARRVDCAYLARLVAEGRLAGDEAAEVAVDLAYRIPKAVFRV
jgi:glucuronate isomerase